MERRARPVTEAELRAALAEADGSPTRAARALGIHRVTVWKLAQRWKVKVRKTVEVS